MLTDGESELDWGCGIRKDSDAASPTLVRGHDPFSKPSLRVFQYGGGSDGNAIERPSGWGIVPTPRRR